jgi:hypothetical protein
MNAITTRRSLARYFATLSPIRPPVAARPPVGDEFVVLPPTYQPLFSIKFWEAWVMFFLGAFFGFGLAALVWFAQ